MMWSQFFLIGHMYLSGKYMARFVGKKSRSPKRHHVFELYALTVDTIVGSIGNMIGWELGYVITSKRKRIVTLTS